jgi:lamin tail-like protein
MTLFPSIPRRSLVIFAAMLIALAVAMVGAGRSVAASLGDVKFVSVGTNAPGTDNNGNRNAEFVRLKNTTGAALDIEGWVLHDAYQNSAGDWGNRYTFKGTALPSGSPFRVDHDSDPTTADHFVMPVGADLYVYNGSGVDSTPTSNTAALYRNFRHVYNNGGDTLYVRTSADASGYVARYKYSPYRVDLTQ